MGADEVKAFLGHLATEMNVAASTQNQAFSALLFLYQEVLKLRLPWIEDIVRILADRRAKEFYAWHSCRNFEFDSDTVKIGVTTEILPGAGRLNNPKPLDQGAGRSDGRASLHSRFPKRPVAL